MKRILALVNEAFGGHGGIAPYNRDILAALSGIAAVPSVEVLLRYARDAVGALPSTGDGFGIVFLETMACGTPALGLAAGGVADAFADGALSRLSVAGNLIEALVETRPTPAQSVRARFGPAAFRARLEAALAGALGEVAMI